MRKFYILSLLLMQSHAFAADPLAQLIKKLDDPNHITCEDMTDSELAEHCARELCGPPGSKTSSMTAKNLKKFITPEMAKELKAIEVDVARVYQQKRNETQDLINELEKRINDPNLSSTDNWDDTDYSYFSNMFWKYITWDIDSSKPLSQRSDLKINEASVDKALLPGIKEFAQEFNKNLYDNPVYAYKSGIYDLEEMKTVMRQKAVTLEGMLTSQNSTTSFDAKKFNQSLSNLEEEEQIISEFQKIEDLANTNGVAFIEGNNCKDKCRKSINHFVKNMGLKTALANLKSSLNNINEKDKIAECKASYISENHQNNLSDNFKKIWPEVKEAYQKNVLPRFSAHSQKMMRDYLESDIHFYFDNPNFKEFPDLKGMIKEKTSTAKDKSSAFLLGDLTMDYFDQDINVFQNEMKICSPYSSPSLIWDSFLANENIMPMSPFQNPHYDTSKDNIAVSPYTCEHHREGSGILAHELGHAMSNLMNRAGMSEGSLRDYRTLRNCATKQWDINDAARHNYHPGDKQFTEEDSADIMSYMAVNDGKSLYACGFLDVSSDESSYANFETEPWGSHSPGLIRLLRESTYKRPNSIPKTCSTLMTRHQDKLGDKKCF